jgi:flagellar basal body-associated protein FliL
MSAVATPAAAPAAVPPVKKGGKMILVIVCLAFAGAGAAFPMLVDVPALFGKAKAEKGKEKAEVKVVAVPFGDVVVNLAEERMTRYLRLKIAVTVDAEHEKEMTELLTKKKAAIKSRIISHLAGKSLKDVAGSVGVHRVQRELLERFEDELSHEENCHIRAVLFEEYVVQ